ncbi:MAG: YdcF family protein [Candidatus Competibacter sp.]|nr:YdcF family protein [Candidatus Competibacter sp.]
MLLFLKIVSQLAYPLSASLLLVGAGVALLWRHRRRTGGLLLGLGLAWLWLWATPAFSDWVRSGLEQRYPPVAVEDLPAADAIVVLGGAMDAAKPPERLYPDLGAAADRVWHAARLFRAGKAPLILVSGGNLPWNNTQQPEAAAIAQLLQEWGVPPAAILLESGSRTTRENRDYSLPILQASGARHILLVTSALHMPRALALFEASPLDVTPAPTDFEVYPKTATPLRWLPDAQALADGTRAFKEYLASRINALTVGENVTAGGEH